MFDIIESNISAFLVSVSENIRSNAREMDCHVWCIIFIFILMFHETSITNENVVADEVKLSTPYFDSFKFS
jgi:hypothetical protein